MKSKENKTEGLKLYSLKSINFATFFGGPIAAGFLVRQNYLALDEPEKAKNSFLIGIISTILLFVGIFSIPEEIINKIPNAVIPLIYTGIIAKVVDSKQGEVLKKHSEEENEFYSGWRATGIGLLFSLIIFAGIFGHAYLSTPKEYDIYEKEMQPFYETEDETIKFLNSMDGRNIPNIISEMNNTIIPKWKRNIRIVQKTNQIENLPSDLVSQNKMLVNYCNFKIEFLELVKKAVMFSTDRYDNDIQVLNSKIDSILDKLNN